MAFYTIAAVAVIVALVSESALAQLTLTPSELRLAGGASTGSVQISCGYSTATTIYTLTVSQFRPQSTEKVLASADTTVNGGQAALDPNSGLTQATATVSGSTNQKSMSLTLTQASCNDAAVYRCSVLYKTGTAAPTEIDYYSNLTVTVPPQNVTMTVDPQIEVGNYIVGTIVTFLCNAMIGSYVPSVQTTWSWEYQDQGLSSWLPYENSEDITTDNPFQGTNPCQYHQTSRLARNLTIYDSQRTYRCTVRRGLDAPSDTYTLGAVDYTEGQTPAPDTGAANNQAAKASVTGAIVGGVIGGVVVIVIVIVLVYFLWYRKRDSGEKYTTRNAEPKPPEPVPVPYPPASTDASYAKSNNRFKNRDNRGVDNKAMDEPVDKPPRYESHVTRPNDNFRKGGRNPGYTDDERRAPRVRTNSSDDGGTDTASVGDGNPNFGTAI